MSTTEKKMALINNNNQNIKMALQKTAKDNNGIDIAININESENDKQTRKERQRVMEKFLITAENYLFTCCEFFENKLTQYGCTPSNEQKFMNFDGIFNSDYPELWAMQNKLINLRNDISYIKSYLYYSDGKGDMSKLFCINELRAMGFDSNWII